MSSENKSMYMRFSRFFSDNLKGLHVASQNYHLNLNDRTSAVNIFDKTLGQWFLRFDGPHKSVDYPHININPKITKAPDPHIPISETVFKASGLAGKICKEVNKALLLVAVTIDTSRIGVSAYEDYKQGTTRNTTTTTSTIAGAWTGSYAGSKSGLAIGTYIWPGFGTLVGGFVGGVVGGTAGYYGGGKIADTISDKWKHDIANVKCNSCRKIHECRKYNKQACSHCPNCKGSGILKFRLWKWRRAA